MPTVLRVNGFRFFFWSLENNEPPHVHVEKGGGYGKWWLKPVRTVYAKGFSPAELRDIEAILHEHEAEILRRWNEHFGD